MQKIDLKNKTVLVTGSAGFIGSNLVLELLRTQSPIHIIGLDNMTTIMTSALKNGDFQR
jgi:nucleoside-diphosphate-sugar epimerase